MLCASLLNIGGYGAIYQMMAVEPKHEANIIRQFTRAGQHACRGHSEPVAKPVTSLFAQTNDLEMEHMKQSVFCVHGEAPIIWNNLSAIQARFKAQTSVYHLPLQCTLYVIDSLQVVCR